MLGPFYGRIRKNRMIENGRIAKQISDLKS
jgi:hypothetical protein